MSRTMVLAWGLVLGFTVGLGIVVGVTIARPDQAPTAVAARAPVTPVMSECTGAPLAERAAQTLVVGLPGVLVPEDPLVAEVLDVGVGGVLLTSGNVRDERQVRRLLGALRSSAPRGLLVTTDEEPGRVSSFRRLLGATSSARTLAARSARDDVAEVAHELGSALAELGVDASLAPVLDLDDGPARGVIGDRSFSADPEVATAYGLAFARGLAAAGVAPTAKHFPGHGRTRVDSHRTLAQVDATFEELLDEDLVPFIALIDAGVPLIMVNHVAYEALDPQLPASLARETYTLLRELGFQGVAITDSTGMGAIHRSWDFGTSAVMAIRAGADAVLTTDGARAAAMRDALVAAAESGELPRDRLDEAAARMLALKGRDPVPVVCRDVAPIPTMWGSGPVG